MPVELSYPGVYIEEIASPHAIDGVPTSVPAHGTAFVPLQKTIDPIIAAIVQETAFAVFEPNNERLWANVRRRADDILFAFWQRGAFPGEKPERGYFVKCDRSTMTQADLAADMLVMLVGLALVKPAEFDIFQIKRQTAAD